MNIAGCLCTSSGGATGWIVRYNGTNRIVFDTEDSELNFAQFNVGNVLMAVDQWFHHGRRWVLSEPCSLLTLGDSIRTTTWQKLPKKEVLGYVILLCSEVLRAESAGLERAACVTPHHVFLSIDGLKLWLAGALHFQETCTETTSASSRDTVFWFGRMMYEMLTLQSPSSRQPDKHGRQNFWIESSTSIEETKCGTRLTKLFDSVLSNDETERPLLEDLLASLQEILDDNDLDQMPTKCTGMAQASESRSRSSSTETLAFSKPVATQLVEKIGDDDVGVSFTALKELKSMAMTGKEASLALLLDIGVLPHLIALLAKPKPSRIQFGSICTIVAMLNYTGWTEIPDVRSLVESSNLKSRLARVAKGATTQQDDFQRSMQVMLANLSDGGANVPAAMRARMAELAGGAQAKETQAAARSLLRDLNDGAAVLSFDLDHRALCIKCHLHPHADRLAKVCESDDSMLCAYYLIRTMKVDPNILDCFGRRPLPTACAFGAHGMAEILLAAGASCHSAGRDGFPPLLRAAQAGHSDIVRCLLEKDDTCIQVRGPHRRTVLHCLPYGLQRKHVEKALGQHPPQSHVSDDVALEVAEVLFDVGGARVQALCNVGDVQGQTPLSLAVWAGNLSVAKLLVSNGASCDWTDANGHSLWWIAELHDMKDLASYLAAIQEPCPPEKGALQTFRSLLEACRDGDLSAVISILAPLCLERERGKEAATSRSRNANVKTPDGEQTATEGEQLREPDERSLYPASIPAVILNLEDAQGNSALSVAAGVGDLPIVRYLVEDAGAACSLVAVENPSLLRACASGRLDIVRYFMEARGVAPLDASDTSPLCAAAAAGHVDVVKYLLKWRRAQEGAEEIPYLQLCPTCIRASPFCSPMYAAALRGHSAVVKLFTAGAGAKEKATSLVVATARDHVDAVRCLIETGGLDPRAHYSLAQCLPRQPRPIEPHLESTPPPPLDRADDRQAGGIGPEPAGEGGAGSSNEHPTLLAIAQRMRAYNVEEFLYTVCEDWVDSVSESTANESGQDTMPSIFQPCETGDYPRVRILISLGANVNGTNDDGQTPLHSAVRSGAEAVVRLLLRKGAAANALDNDGRTPLHDAARLGLVSISRCLVDAGAETSKPDRSGETPLLIACAEGYLDAVRFLLEERGADSSHKNSDGRGALHVSSGSGQLDVVKYLLRRAEDATADLGDAVAVDLGDRKGMTPLMCAAQIGSLGVVRALVERGGADIRKISADGNTAVDVAASHHREGVVSYLNGRLQDLKKAMRADDHLAECPSCRDWKASTSTSAPKKRAKKKKTLGMMNQMFGSDLDLPLLLPATRGNVACVRFRLDEGAEVDQPGDCGWTPLMVSVCQGNFDVAKLLIERGASLEQTNDVGMSAAFIAACEGEYGILRYLVSKGADYEKTNRQGMTPMGAAAAEGHVDVVRYLVEIGADVDGAGPDACAPLYIACGRGQAEVAKYLVTHGADVEKRGVGSMTPLMQAAHVGQLAIVRYLVEHGEADIEKTDDTGGTAIFPAALGGHLSVVSYLCQRGARLEFPNRAGCTPLFAACVGGNVKVVKYLVARGAIFYRLDHTGGTPLDMAVRQGREDVVAYLSKLKRAVSSRRGHTLPDVLIDACAAGDLDCVRRLYILGADLNSMGSSGLRPLHAACHAGHENVTRFLVGKGADVGARDRKEKFTALHHAAAKGSVPVVKCLLEDAQADMEVGDVCGRAPLSIAAIHGHVDVMKCLLDSGADCNHIETVGTTALFRAAQAGCLAAVQCLVEAGADVAAVDMYGTTALMEARGLGHANVVSFLEAVEDTTVQPTTEGLGAREDVGRPNKHGAEDRLSEACFKGDADAVRKLLANGASVGDNCSVAAEAGHDVIVRMLVESGADCGVVAKDTGLTPLLAASREGHEGIVQYLLKKGADVHVRCLESQTALSLAAENGHAEVVRLLLLAGAEVNSTDQIGRSPLFFAAREGHLDIVQRLVNFGADHTTCDERGVSPLAAAQSLKRSDVVSFLSNLPELTSTSTPEVVWEACRQGDLERLRRLLLPGMDIEAQGESGNTLLIEAIRHDHRDLAQYLLEEKGARVETANVRGEGPLYSAIEADRLEIVKLLLAHGADVNGREEECGWTPSLTASFYGRVDVLRELVAKKASLDLATTDGETPLLMAVRLSRLDVVRYLVEHGASLEGSYTPLMAACQQGWAECAEYLRRKGARVDATDPQGRTPEDIAREEGHDELAGRLRLWDPDEGHATLCVACKGGIVGADALVAACRAGKEECVHHLLKQGADVAAHDSNGVTALFAAACHGRLSLVSLVAEQGVDVDQPVRAATVEGSLAQAFGVCDPKPSTPLAAAAAAGYTEVVQFLLGRGADASGLGTAEACSPLYAACRHGHVCIVRCLAEAGVDLGSSSSLSLVFAASASGHDAVVRLLLEAGADSDGRCGGWTPVLAACKNGHVSVVRTLVELGANLSLNHEGSDDGGIPPLHVAAREGHVDIVRVLVEEGVVDWEAKHGAKGHTAKDIARAHSRKDVVAYLDGLAKKKASAITEHPSKCDSCHHASAGAMSQIQASRTGALACLRYLLHQCKSGTGETSEATNAAGMTPLYAASRYGHLPLVRFLVARGADAHVRRVRGGTPLLVAAQHGHLGVVRFLVGCGVDCDKGDFDDMTPVLAASREGHLSVLRFLVRRGGADCRRVDESGATAVCLAAKAGHLGVVEFLVGEGADVAAADEDGCTPVYVAAENGRLDMVKYLVAKGATFEAPINDGWTPVFIAARNGHLGVVKYLSDKGADIFRETKDGVTPLEIAKAKGRSEVITYLKTFRPPAKKKKRQRN